MTAHVSSARLAGPLVDAEHPWLGLHPFTEENQKFFFGRTTEIRDIFLRVREHPLTVLYGQSGLGKTSLLRAGLIPKLRVERYRPERILLNFDAAAPPLIMQVRAALAKACSSEPAEATVLLNRWKSLGSLWEILSHEELRPTHILEHPPVLIFDQFEEIFTLGELEDENGPRTDPRQAQVSELITQLADVIEGRAPVALAGFGSDPQRALAYDFGPTAVRIVFTLREDYLAQLERWKATLPSLMRNRMPLRLLSGPQALEAVVRPGTMGVKALVTTQVGMRIVRFVAERNDVTPLEEIEAVPPFVSLLCERLNEARLATDPPSSEITRDLVDSQGADILQRFYDESFEILPAAQRDLVREYVEDQMVSFSGLRNPVAREDAVAGLRALGVLEADAALDVLVGRRLLTAEQRGGILRLEVTHDVLAPLAVRARKARHERRAERQRVQLRRARMVAIGFAIVGVVAVAAMFFAFRNLEKAHEERARAITAKKSAEGLIRYMRNDLSKTLAKLGLFKMAEKTNSQIRQYYEEHPLDKGDNEGLRERTVSDIQQGDIFLAQGRVADAFKSYHDAFVVRERLARQAPQNTTWQRDLSESFKRLGDVSAAKAQLAEAMKAYRDALMITEQLAKRDPNNADWQRDISVYLINIGDIFEAQGHLAEAMKSQEDALAIREGLTKQDQENPGFQRDLAESFNNLGDILTEKGQVAQAMKRYRSASVIAERLAGQDPNNAQWQRDLAVSFSHVGDVLRAQAQPTEAMKAYRNAFSIRDRLAKQDPENADSQRDLMNAFIQLGDLLIQDDTTEAMKVYRDGLAIAERFAKRDPGNPRWQRSLAVSFDNIGDVLQDQMLWEEALKYHRDAVAIFDRLAKDFPDNATWQRDLNLGLTRVATVLRRQGELDEALKVCQESLAIAQRLANQDPDNATWQDTLSTNLERIGNILDDQDKLEEALRPHLESLAIRERLANGDTDDSQRQRNVSYSLIAVARLRERQGKMGEALSFYERAVVIAQRLTKLDPTNAIWQRDVAVSTAGVERIREVLKKKKNKHGGT